MRVQFSILNDKIECGEVFFCCELAIIPREKESVNVADFLKVEDYNKIRKTSQCWSGEEAKVIVVCLRQDDKGFYYMIWLECEDCKIYGNRNQFSPVQSLLKQEA